MFTMKNQIIEGHAPYKEFTGKPVATILFVSVDQQQFEPIQVQYKPDALTTISREASI